MESAPNRTAMFAAVSRGLFRLEKASPWVLDDVLALVLVGPVGQQLRDQFDSLFPRSVASPARLSAPAAHARTVSAREVTWIVATTDGVVNTARHLGLDDWPVIARHGATELACLLQDCHGWEEDADPGGKLPPRARRHDDKGIAVLAMDLPVSRERREEIPSATWC